MSDPKRPPVTVNVPSAEIRAQPRFDWVWLLPMLALVFAGWLGYRAWSIRGVVINVQFELGHGIKPTDEVRYRGATVGEVTEVSLAPAGEGVIVTASLDEEARSLASAGSRFWVVRPQLRLTHVEGLETLVGPRHLAVLPGSGASQRRFIGLNEAPVYGDDQPLAEGGLEIVVNAMKRGSLARGAPVVYRQVPIGRVLSVGLTSDAGAVEARLYIDPAYTQLIRKRTAFWDAGGIRVRVGLAGLDLEVDSIESALIGSVGVATPANAGEVARTGHRFELTPDAPDDWIEWEPLIVIGSAQLPPGVPLPNPLRSKLVWRQGLLKAARSRQGWVLQTEEGLLGPVDLLSPPDKAVEGTEGFEVAGGMFSAPTKLITWQRGGLAMVEAAVHEPEWPGHLMRAPGEPEDCIAVADPTDDPLSLGAARFESRDGAWRVDPVVSLDDSWHGACVLARSDGALIGMLLVEDGEVRVALLEEK